jgi:hypothetical protein
LPRIAEVTKDDIEKNVKRVNICLSIREFDDLALCAEYNKMPTGTLAASWVKMRSSIESLQIRKSKYVPIAMRGENLFKAVSLKTKKKGKK